MATGLVATFLCPPAHATQGGVEEWPEGSNGSGLAGATLNGPEDSFLKAVRFDQKLDSQVPMDAMLRDESGRLAPLGAYFNGKPVVLVCVYFKCTMNCSEVLDEAVRSAKAQRFTVGKEYNVIALSIDHNETPKIASDEKAEHMKDYGRPGSERGWHFLTGDEKQIHRVTDSIGFHFAYDARSRQFAHPDGMVVLTPTGRIARYFYGVSYPPQDLKFGLIEATSGKIGSPVDHLLLTCYHYDPQSGTYDVLVMKLIQLGAVVTILLLGGGVVLALRAEKKFRPSVPVVDPKTVSKV